MIYKLHVGINRFLYYLNLQVPYQLHACINCDVTEYVPWSTFSSLVNFTFYENKIIRQEVGEFLQRAEGAFYTCMNKSKYKLFMNYTHVFAFKCLLSDVALVCCLKFFLPKYQIYIQIIDHYNY